MSVTHLKPGGKMITRKSIEQYVKTQPSITQSAFYTLLLRKDKYAIGFLNLIEDKINYLVLNKRINVSPTINKSLVECLLEQYEIEDLMLILESELNRESQTFLFKIKRFFYKPLFDPMMAYILDIDKQYLTDENRGYFGDALVLAFLHHRVDAIEP